MTIEMPSGIPFDEYTDSGLLIVSAKIEQIWGQTATENLQLVGRAAIARINDGRTDDPAIWNLASRTLVQQNTQEERK